jgi:hypothetical protein
MGREESPVILSEAKNLKMRNTWHRPCFSYFEILTLTPAQRTSLRMTEMTRMS